MIPLAGPLEALLPASTAARIAGATAGSRLLLEALLRAPLSLTLTNSTAWLFGAPGAPGSPGIRLCDMPPDLAAACHAAVLDANAAVLWRTPPLIFSARFEATGFLHNGALNDVFARAAAVTMLVLRTRALGPLWARVLGPAHPLSDYLALPDAPSLEAACAAPRPRRVWIGCFSVFGGARRPAHQRRRAARPETHPQSDGRFAAALARTREQGGYPWEALAMALRAPARAPAGGLQGALRYIDATSGGWRLPHPLFRAIAIIACDAGGRVPGVEQPAYLYPLALALKRTGHTAAAAVLAAWRAAAWTRDPRPRVRAPVHMSGFSGRELREAAMEEGEEVPSDLVTPHPATETHIDDFIIGYTTSGEPLHVRNAPVLAIVVGCGSRAAGEPSGHCSNGGSPEACVFAAAVNAGW